MKLDREPDEVVPHILEKCQEHQRVCLCTMKCCKIRYKYEGGVVTHDLWKPYHKYRNMNHAMCGSRLERKLVDNSPIN